MGPDTTAQSAAFTSSIKGLYPSANDYVRAYAIYEAGLIGCGPTVTFITLLQ